MPSIMRCARHALLNCALCGPDGKRVIAMTPAREHARREVRVWDFGLAKLNAAAREHWDRDLDADERRTFLTREVLKRADRDTPQYDTNDTRAIIAADIASKATRGRLYSLRNGSARCPRCEARVGVSDLLPVVGWRVQIPNFGKCGTCQGEGEEGCAECHGLGYVITSWTPATAYLACEPCVARDRQPTKRGSATNFTTTSRAGEERGKRAPREAPMCPSCQQRYGGVKRAECRPCYEARLHREALEIKREIARLRAALGDTSAS